MAIQIDDVTDDAPSANRINHFSDILKSRGIAICLMGNDGSGKTTLSEELSRQFTKSGIPNKRLHIYNWYKHVFITPIILILNRYIFREVLIFDRSIYDTVAVFFSKKTYSDWQIRILNFILKIMYPAFDHRIYLEIPLDETIKRRPDTDPDIYYAMIGVYRPLSQYHDFTMLNTKQSVLTEVLDQILIDNQS